MDALNDLLENLADVSAAVAALQGGPWQQAVAAAQQEGDDVAGTLAGAGGDTGAELAVHAAGCAGEVYGECSNGAAAGCGAVEAANGSSVGEKRRASTSVPAAAEAHHIHSSGGEHADSSSSGSGMSAQLGHAAWLLQILLLMDAIAAFAGDDAHLPEPHVQHFLSTAAAFSPAVRAQVLQEAVQEGQLRSGRLKALPAAAWEELDVAVLRQLLQVPSSRKRQRR